MNPLIGKLKLSLSTGSLYLYPLHTIFKMAKEAGFSGVELVAGPEVLLRGGKYVRELSERYALPILSLHPPLPPFSELDVKIIAPWLVELAWEVHCPLVILHTPKVIDLNGKLGRSYLETVVKSRWRVEGTATKIAIENRVFSREQDWDYALGDLRELRAFADEHDLALVLDTAHAGTSTYSLTEAYRFFDGRLANVHLSDIRYVPPLLDIPRLHNSLKHHQMPGCGWLPLVGFLRELVVNGYSGPVTLEVSPLALGIWWPPRVRHNLIRYMTYIEEALAGFRP